MDKICHACNQPKSLDEFKRNRKTPDGRTYICTECLRARRGPALPLTPDERRQRQLTKIRERHADDPQYRERHDDSRRKSAHGLLPEQYRAILDLQDGVCAICKQPPSATKGRGDLHVEHCHDTEIIRGLACFHCNAGLGHFGHDPGLLRAAANYLENPPVNIARRPPRQRVRAECGTMGGYMRHRRAGEEICEACYRAKREYDRKMRAERADGRERKRRVEAICGTPSGYAKHYRLGEKPCDECRKTMAEYNAQRRQNSSSP